MNPFLLNCSVEHNRKELNINLNDTFFSGVGDIAIGKRAVVTHIDDPEVAFALRIVPAHSSEGAKIQAKPSKIEFPTSVFKDFAWVQDPEQVLNPGPFALSAKVVYKDFVVFSRIPDAQIAKPRKNIRTTHSVTIPKNVIKGSVLTFDVLDGVPTDYKFVLKQRGTQVRSKFTEGEDVAQLLGVFKQMQAGRFYLAKEMDEFVFTVTGHRTNRKWSSLLARYERLQTDPRFLRKLTVDKSKRKHKYMITNMFSIR